MTYVKQTVGPIIYISRNPNEGGLFNLNIGAIESSDRNGVSSGFWHMKWESDTVRGMYWTPLTLIENGGIAGKGVFQKGSGPEWKVWYVDEDYLKSAIGI